MRRIITILFCFTLIVVSCQEPFELLISGPNSETPGEILIDEQGNYLIVGASLEVNSIISSGLIVKVLQSGEVSTFDTYSYPDSTCSFYNIIKLDSNYLIFGGIGPGDIGLSSILICSFDFDLNLQWRKSYKFSDVHILGNYKTKIDLDGNIVCFGSTLKDSKNLDSDPFEFRCSTSGDSLLMVSESIFNNQRVFDFLIKPDSSGYIVFGSAKYPPYPFIDANGAYYNHSFIREQVREVPNDVHWSHTVRWINDEEFFISGNKTTTIGYELIQGVGLMRLDTAFSVIGEVYFNLIPDTVCYPAWIRNFDYIDINEVFFAGTKNYEYWLQEIPSWITLHKFDANLNIVFERCFGGDVMYTAHQVKATEDGGCIILGLRYDYNFPDDHYDLYLIKTDENGLVTSINEENELKKSKTLVHPNPCTNVIAFANDLSLIEIFNRNGQLVFRYENYLESTPIAVEYFIPGIYIYKTLDHENKYSAGKMVKM